MSYNQEQESEGGRFGPKAEAYVERFLENVFPYARVRHATEREDSGNKELGGQKVDSILYVQNEPSLAVQVTTNTASEIQQRKSEDLQSENFVQIRDPETGHVSLVPRIQVYVPTREMLKVEQSRDAASEAAVNRQILRSAFLSLVYIILKRPEQFRQTIMDAYGKLNMIESVARRMVQESDTKENRVLLGELLRSKVLIERKILKLSRLN